MLGRHHPPLCFTELMKKVPFWITFFILMELVSVCQEEAWAPGVEVQGTSARGQWELNCSSVTGLGPVLFVLWPQKSHCFCVVCPSPPFPEALLFLECDFTECKLFWHYGQNDCICWMPARIFHWLPDMTKKLFLVYPLGRSLGNQEVMFSVFQGMGTFQEDGGRKKE